MNTEIYIDGARLDFEDTGRDSTIRDLVRAMEKELKPLRRYVSALSADGEPIAEWRSGTGLERPVLDCSEISLHTASFDEAALGGLDIIRRYVSLISENAAVCVSSLRRGGPAGEKLSSIVEGAVEVIRTVEALSIGGNAYDIDLFKESPAECCGSMVRAIESLKEAGDRMDSVSMADMLEYELVPAVNELEDMLNPPEA